MPASYVHQSVARQALASFGFEEDEALRFAALAGAEGPDPLFFSLAPNPGGPYPPKVGGLMHTQRTDEFLAALSEACRGSALLRAYCLGFFTHYATDTTFHPFVYAHSLTAQGAYSSTEHCLLEHNLETLYYRRSGHAEGLPVQMAGCAALAPVQKDEIARALAPAIAQIYPDSALSVERVRRSFDDAASVCRMLRSESGRKYRGLGAMLAPLRLDRALHAHMMPTEPPEEDIANDAHAPWASPWVPDETRTEGFDELFAAAVDRARELAACADGAMRGRVSLASLRSLTGGLSYDSGLPWRQTCPPDQAPGVLRAKAERSASRTK